MRVDFHMYQIRKFCLIGMVLLLTVVAIPRIASARIPRNVTLELEQRLIPANRTGDLRQVIASGSAIVNQVGDPVITEIDAFLASEDLPRLYVLLAESRFTLMMAQQQNIRQPTPKEMIFIAPHFQQRVDAIIQGSLRPPIMQQGAQSPTTLAEYKTALWDLHVYRNELANVERINLIFGRTIQSIIEQEKQPPAQKNLISLDFEAAHQRILRENKIRFETELHLRESRIHLASSIIGTENSLQRKLAVAFAMDQDIKLIEEYGKRQLAGEHHNVVLPELAPLKQTFTESQQTDPLLFKKAEHLYTGIHWWMRGRYGKGIAANGLLKGAHVKEKPQLGFAIQMPRETPVAQNPFATTGQDAAPYVARRHDHIWSWENGGISYEKSSVSVVAQSKYFH